MARAAQDNAPIESFFEANGGLDITNEIDRKIDEALALAQKLRSAGATAKAPMPTAAASNVHDSGLDELDDMPSFLRNSNSDIALD